jgi:glycosyltransferase involved in cell wall biosynthesis
VSVIIPVYRGERFLAQAIESALAQTYRDIELIVVDDGSPDRSEESIAAHFGDPRLTYIRQDNRGVAAARNHGIRASAGQLIAFLDQDDVWLPDKLGRQVAALADHPAAMLVHGYQAYIDATGARIPYAADWVADLEGACFRDLFLRNRIGILTAVVRRECFDAVGPFNESIPGADDYELWLRIARQFPIAFVGGLPLACYRVHDANVSHDHFRMELAELCAISSIVERFPDVRATVGDRTVDTRLFELNSSLAGWHAWKSRDFAQARRHLLRAAARRPFAWKTYLRLGWCALTDGQRRAIRWYGHRLRAFGDRWSG